MQYQGGKSRIAKEISEVINKVSRYEVTNNDEKETQKVFVSLFCGVCSIENKVEGFNKKILNDKHEYLIELLNGVKGGYELPEVVTEEQYKHVKDNKDEDKILSGFVGFGCSFGGKWFGGYAKNKANRNYALKAKKLLLKNMENLMDATFICKDYRDVELPKGCVVYADCPYDGTTGYGKEKFNSHDFWEYMRKISKEHMVFISEQNAPDDFITIWEKPFTRTLDVNKENQFKVIEKLFIHKCNLDKYNQAINAYKDKKGE